MTRLTLPPEVVQTSAMDCGPAALKCVLEGHGIAASYGRLREACQTSVDGTSIDVIEAVACQLGLVAEQALIPADFLLDRDSTSLPAIVVTALPGGLTHFVVVWRRLGPWFLVMDPADGRHWVREADLRQRLYDHRMVVDAADWEAWARSDEHLAKLRNAGRRLVGAEFETHLQAAIAVPGHLALATLDAVIRFVGSLAQDGLPKRAVIPTLAGLLRQENPADIIPSWCWAARPISDDQVEVRGAVAVSIAGTTGAQDELPAELQAVVTEPTLRVWSWVFSSVGKDTRANLAIAAALALLVSAGAVIEAALINAFFQTHAQWTGLSDKLSVAATFVAFMTLMALSYAAMGLLTRSAGRVIEVNMRQALHLKLPRLRPRYFASRLRSDMIERAHALSGLRSIPQHLVEAWSGASTLFAASLAVIWLRPELIWMTILAAIALVAMPILLQPILQDRELRARVHAASRGQTVLDALLGAVAIRAHGAHQALSAEHEGRLVDYVRAQRTYVSAAAWVNGTQSMVAAGIAAALVYGSWTGQHDMAAALLLVYWVQRMGAGAQGVAQACFAYPTLKNVLIRLDEILRSEVVAPTPLIENKSGIIFQNCDVVANGRAILQNINCEITQGEHIALVGPSGAGKSTFVQAILGLHEDIHGTLLVGGMAPSPGRSDIMWVDPSVQLWNTDILHNVLYANPETTDVMSMIGDAELTGVVAQSAHGLRTEVGEDGRLLSGGEGQRARLARGMGLDNPNIIILDEAMRGLPREQRMRIANTIREKWPSSTILEVTHDVASTTQHKRVLVFENGLLVEDGSPDLLTQNKNTYFRLCESEADLRQQTWQDPTWTQWSLQDGNLTVVDGVLSKEVSAPSTAPSPSLNAHWPMENLPDLVREIGVLLDVSITSTPAFSNDPEPFFADLLDLGLSFHSIGTDVGNLPQVLSACVPALLELDGQMVFCVSATSESVRVFTPKGHQIISLDELRHLIVGDSIDQLRQRIIESIDGCNPTPVANALVNRRLAEVAAPRVWRVERRRANSFFEQLGRVHVGAWLLALIGLDVAIYTATTAGWWIIGRTSLFGVGGEGALISWALAAATVAFLGALHVWVAGMIAVRIGIATSQTMMSGALAFATERLRKMGPGRLMGQMYESEAAVSMLLSGGLAAVSGIMALIFSFWVLSNGAFGTVLSVSLLLWIIVLAACFMPFERLLQNWTEHRISLTALLVERMLGHTTRLLQCPTDHTYAGEDHQLRHYLESARRFDRSSVTMAVLFGRGWLFIAVCVFFGAWIQAPDTTTGEIAVAWGGILLAGEALSLARLVFLSAANGRVAWHQISPFIQAAATPLVLGANVVGSREPGELRARGLSVRHSDRRILADCDATVRPGEHVLLQGESGSGKSTLAAILAGLKTPNSGVVTAAGFDTAALGPNRWRRHATLIPQFHENYVFTGTLAMNLLIGKTWPPAPDDMERAADVCIALGLGPLLDAMPSGLNQQVGESGWALSHGERNRVFIARALLQNPDVAIFDESFSALDPETLKHVISVVRERCTSSVVIAHP